MTSCPLKASTTGVAWGFNDHHAWVWAPHVQACAIPLPIPGHAPPRRTPLWQQPPENGWEKITETPASDRRRLGGFTHRNYWTARSLAPKWLPPRPRHVDLSVVDIPAPPERGDAPGLLPSGQDPTAGPLPRPDPRADLSRQERRVRELSLNFQTFSLHSTRVAPAATARKEPTKITTIQTRPAPGKNGRSPGPPPRLPPWAASRLRLRAH
jgi:hypothetical protein